MKTSTTTRGGRSYGTVFSQGSCSMNEIPAHRLVVGIYGSPTRESVVLQGRYVAGPNGVHEVVVSVDQKAFKRAVAVREINSRIDGRTSVDIDTALRTATTK